MKTYKCVNCGKAIDPMRDFLCPYCNYEQPLDRMAKKLGETIVDIPCPKCGFEKSFLRSSSYLDVAYCPRCDETTYVNKEGKKPMPVCNTSPSVECPYCHSKNTRKISSASKVGGIALFGIFALNKATKQWHCNECKSDF